MNTSLFDVPPRTRDVGCEELALEHHPTRSEEWQQTVYAAFEGRTDVPNEICVLTRHPNSGRPCFTIGSHVGLMANVFFYAEFTNPSTPNFLLNSCPYYGGQGYGDSIAYWFEGHKRGYCTFRADSRWKLLFVRAIFVLGYDVSHVCQIMNMQVSAHEKAEWSVWFGKELKRRDLPRITFQEVRG